MNDIYIKYKYMLLPTMFLLLIALPLKQGMAQDTDLKRTYMRSSIIQDQDNFKFSATIWAKIAGTKTKDYLANQSLSIMYVTDTMSELIGSIQTDRSGSAHLNFPKSKLNQPDAEGFHYFQIEFVGNDSLKQIVKDLTIKKADISMEFTIVDSVKMIEFKAFEIDATGDRIPINEMDIYVYVKSLFNPLKVGSSWIEEGEASFEFPMDLPGDTLGNLNFIAKIEDSDDHGIIEVMGNKDWALKKVINHEIDRGLGDTAAPLWMVYTLITLLSLVWFHYIYIIYIYFVIKREGDKIKN